MTEDSQKIGRGIDRIRCQRCDRDLVYSRTNSEIMNYGNVITFTCKQCGSSMEVLF